MPVKLVLAFNSEANPYVRHGRILWMARIAQGRSREDLAVEMGVCREAIRLWETGQRSIDGVMLGRLALALDQSAEVLTGVIGDSLNLRAQLERQGLAQFWELSAGAAFRILGDAPELLEKLEGGLARRVKGGEAVAVSPGTIVQVSRTCGNHL